MNTTLEPGAHICIVLLTGLGDVVHGLPVVNALKRRDPSCRITWVVEPMPAPLLQPHPAVDEVVIYNKADGVRGVRELWRELRDRPADLTLNLNIYFKSVWPTILSGAPNRLGFDRQRSRDLVWLFANRRLPARPRGHTQDMFLEFLEVLGVPAAPLAWRMEPTPEERAEQSSFVERFEGRRVAALVPASANAKKDWLPERLAEVANGLEHDFGFATMLVGGPSAREAEIAAAVRALASRAPVDARGDGIRRLIWLLEASDLVIAPDTGPVHIARAMDVPVIGLYGHTNPWRVGPYRRFEDLWVDAYTEPGSAPDPSGWEPKHERMERITVKDVLERVQRAVDRYLDRGRNEPGESAPGPTQAGPQAEPGSRS